MAPEWIQLCSLDDRNMSPLIANWERICNVRLSCNEPTKGPWPKMNVTLVRMAGWLVAWCRCYNQIQKRNYAFRSSIHSFYVAERLIIMSGLLDSMVERRARARRVKVMRRRVSERVVCVAQNSEASRITHHTRFHDLRAAQPVLRLVHTPARRYGGHYVYLVWFLYYFSFFKFFFRFIQFNIFLYCIYSCLQRTVNWKGIHLCMLANQIVSLSLEFSIVRYSVGRGQAFGLFFFGFLVRRRFIPYELSAFEQ